MATAFIAIAATGIASATGHGEAGLADVSFSGTDGSVGYTASLAADHSSALVNLASGTFAITPEAVTVLAADGTVVGSIPTTFGQFAVAPALNAAGTQLSLTPIGGPTTEAVLSQDLPGVQQAWGPISIVVGATIGCAIGFAIGIWFFLVGAIPGCLIGAAVGATLGFFSPFP
ncbi:hypothetical protein [Nocardia sp. NPDC050793]|uniref:hypothetical protein n=1 Tax=Nocardia sp. NPDC050793 TaxID=3155159 RepID=UPI0033E457F0